MTTPIELTEQAERQLRELQQETGRPAGEVIGDAIAALHAQRPRQGVQPWPTSIGSGGDAGVDSSDLDDWLKEHWTEP